MHAVDLLASDGREALTRCARPGCENTAGGWEEPSLCGACSLEAFLFERTLRWELRGRNAPVEEPAPRAH